MKRPIFILLWAVLAITPFHILRSAESGSKVPACTLTSMDTGDSYELQKFAGKVLYVDFWASWCPPCVKSFPFLNELDHDLRDQGLQIIGVNLDEIPEDAREFFAQHRPDFPVAFDREAQCAKNLNVKGMPSAYLIDRNGIIRHVHLGFRGGDGPELRRLIEQLLTEKPANDEELSVSLRGL